jgi:predicted membrane protein
MPISTFQAPLPDLVLPYKQNKMNDSYRQEQRQKNTEGKSTWVGIIFLVVGGLLLARMAGFHFLDWIFQWEFILIAIGLIIGFKEGFRNLTWLILVGIGTFFLLDDLLPDFNLRRMIIPAVFIGIGLFMVFGRNRTGISVPAQKGPEIPNDPLRTSYEGMDPLDATANAGPSQATTISDGLGSDASTENMLNISAIFGGVKKTILSKNFRGGEIVSVFGGAEVNLLHADMPEPVVIDCVTIFGGTKLFIPHNWEIKSEAVAIFGGVEDKRQFPHITQVPNKTVILKGFSMFGGIEIKSY